MLCGCSVAGALETDLCSGVILHKGSCSLITSQGEHVRLVTDRWARPHTLNKGAGLVGRPVM